MPPVTNVVFLVLDSCRTDALEEYASGLVPDGSLVFENAIAPSTWSVPSHASLFTGEYPHEHGMHSGDESFGRLPVVDLFNDHGYHTSGFSSNGFLSEPNDFDESFDEFQYTQRGMHHAGLDTRQFILDNLDSNELRAKARVALGILRTSVAHDNPLPSLYNVWRLFYNNLLFSRFDRLNDVPHPFFAPTRLYQYDPSWNTNYIRKAIRENTENDRPFFVFANYMDPHNPYFPRAEFQREFLGEVLSYRTIRRLNEEYGRPVDHIEKLQAGGVPEDIMETLRGLYAGEVKSLEGEVEAIRSSLKERGVLDETLLIITADHGENLGEPNEYGEPRVGHVDSVSDSLLNVPLIFSHPGLPDESVTDRVSLNQLADVLRTVAETGEISTEQILRDLLSDDGVVVAERPADRSTRWERAPGIPEEIANRESFEHTCVAYLDDWKVAINTASDEFAWEAGEERSIDAAPRRLIERCRSHLDQLQSSIPLADSHEDFDVSDEVLAELKNLGYR